MNPRRGLDGARPAIAPFLDVAPGRIDHYIIVAVLETPPGQDPHIQVARNEGLPADLGVAMLETAAEMLKEST